MPSVMEDIIILSKDIDEHIHQVDEIITTIGEAVIILNVKKCRFLAI